MSSTLAQPPGDGTRGLRPSRAVAAVAVVAAVVMGAVWWAGAGPGSDEVRRLRPSEAGTYRVVGTEHDSRTGASTRLTATYTVEPWFARNGVERQVTRFEEGTGGTGHWETAYRDTEAVRLHESSDGVSWDWAPPLRTMALPLAAGRTWSSRSTAVVPDVAGVRRVTDVSGRTRVARRATVDVAGHQVRVLVLESRTSTRMTTTNRVDRREVRVSSVSEATSWFSPRHNLVVRAEVTTTVQDDSEGSRPYMVTRRTRLEQLTPAAG